ncbi:5-formyltetrahydrofolate cyclo-ligase [hydrothermal vent metagenome]|uniref:5-formyltetrahydrofolate cyclo-ligase n=1 Tax=hydrothermal vent metagenome TaxID=652676 RepID=A0A3B0VYR8_9ZZZZ
MTDLLNSDLLRKKLRLQRQSLSDAQQLHHAQQAKQYLHDFLIHFQNSTAQKTLNIAFFLAQDGEMPTAQAIEMLWQSSPYTLFLPILKSTPHDGHMVFAEYTPNSPMKPNQFGILEPSLNHPLPITGKELDIVLTPLVGFDSSGNRMGMGGGYYDRTFQFKQQSSKISSPRLIGWAHSCQQVTQLPTNFWDIPLNGVITEMGLMNFNVDKT